MSRLHFFGVFAVLLATLLLAAPNAEASIMTGWAGNTYPLGTQVDGHVNFMVLDRTGGVAGDTWGTGVSGFDSAFATTGGGPLDTGAKYLYLYQTVNDGSNTNGLSQNSVAVKSAFITSYGWFVQVGFTDGTNLTKAVLPAAGPFVGGASGAASAPPGSQAPKYVNSTLAGVKADLAAVAPYQLGDTGTSLIAFYYNVSPYNAPLASGKVSAVWGYTSDTPPVWAPTGMIDGGTVGQGTVPIADIIPEPATLGIWSALGALAVTGVWWRRRKGR